ncbi:MAG: copper resistance protein CopC/CopD [Solirubrobacterales bacterium]|nr:copper resistance protein CopC/CopD [Solirubrobacterales bacterium]
MAGRGGGGGVVLWGAGARGGLWRARVLWRLVVVVVAFGVLPGGAWGHAQLMSSSPAGNAVVGREPSVVSFSFGESVGIEGEAVRVFDRDGRRVDSGGAFHVGGSGSVVGVRLRHGLPDGTYTATYRVVSADTHIVTGGFVFSIGSRSASGGVALGRLAAGGGSGPVSDTAFAAARGVQYAAIALAAGLLVFLLGVWSAALQRAGAGPEAWREASRRYLSRVRVVLLGCCVAGAVSALVGIVLQGAEARGVDFWQGIGTGTVSEVIPSRFGIVWGAGFVAWLVALIVLVAPFARGSAAGVVPRPATLGATGVALPAARTRWPLSAIGIPLAALLALPALAGHPTIQHPVWLFAPTNVVHVVATSLWLGGLVGLLIGALTLPRDEGDAAVGTRVLAAALARFSPLALGCVVVLIATGVVQALIEVSAWSQFVETGYGRAIVVKVAALSVLIGLGARQRRRSIPAVSAAVQAGGAPVGPARLLVRTLAAELAMLLVVLGAVGSLAGSAPAREASSPMGSATAGMGAMPGMAMPSGGAGAARITTTLGAARIKISLTPGRVGPNTIALALSDARTGHPFTATKQLTVTASLSRQQIGPLSLPVHRTGPGRYVSAGAVLGAPGAWTLQIIDRTSEFEQSERTVSVLVK